MSIYVNKVQLLGYLGADPEERGNSGKGPVVIRLATSEKWKDKDGNKQEKTQWHSVTVWPEPSKNFLMEYAKKGDLVYVEGQLEYSQYEKDGQTVYRTEIVVKPFSGSVQLNSKERGETSQKSRDGGYSSSYESSSRQDYQSGQTSSRPGASRPGQSRPAFGDVDDDIPF